jgi:hypothetical protein
MYQFLTGLFYGFIGGLIFGLSFPYMYRIYKRYKFNGDTRKAIIEEAFLVCSSQLFDGLYNSLNKDVKMPDLPELINVSTNILNISPEYNKSFRLIFKKGRPIINITDKKLMNNKNFIDIMKFFKKNDIEIILSSTSNEILEIQ